MKSLWSCLIFRFGSHKPSQVLEPARNRKEKQFNQHYHYNSCHSQAQLTFIVSVTPQKLNFLVRETRHRNGFHAMCRIETASKTLWENIIVNRFSSLFNVFENLLLTIFLNILYSRNCQLKRKREKSQHSSVFVVEKFLADVAILCVWLRLSTHSSCLHRWHLSRSNQSTAYCHQHPPALAGYRCSPDLICSWLEPIIGRWIICDRFFLFTFCIFLETFNKTLEMQ